MKYSVGAAAAEPRLHLARQVLPHAIDLLVGVPSIHAIHDEHDLLSPLANVREEVELARGQRLEQARDEQHQIRARHELARERLFHPLDRVRPRRIHDVEIAQDIERVVVQVRVLPDRLRRPRLAVAQDRDRARRRQVAHREHLVAEQRIDERALPAVVLADDDEEKELVHLADERGEPLDVRARAVGAREHVAHAQYEPALEGDELALLSGENLFQAQWR